MEIMSYLLQLEGTFHIICNEIWEKYSNQFIFLENKNLHNLWIFI
jgi:hypothetical protein